MSGDPPRQDTGSPESDEREISDLIGFELTLALIYLGFTNATAFSPTDAMPLALWAKNTMALQALISLVIIGLVVARAVNVFA
jgi:hypothetical protein